MNRKIFKILSKRQMQRRVKNNKNVLIQKSYQTTNENDSSSNILTSNSKMFFSDAATVPDAAHKASVNVGQATSTFSNRIEFDSKLTENININENLVSYHSFSSSQKHLNNQLREWTFKNNISCSAVSELLGILKVDPGVNQYMVRRLASLGGLGVEGVTRRIMKFLLTNELGNQFNWKGRHKKIGFEKTTTMVIVYEAAKLNCPTQEQNDMRVAWSVKEWLKHSVTRIKQGHKKN